MKTGEKDRMDTLLKKSLNERDKLPLFVCRVGHKLVPHRCCNTVMSKGQNVKEPIISVSGLRGIVGESLSPDVAMRYAIAFAQGTPKLEINIAEQKMNLSAAEMAEDAVINYIPGDTVKYTLTASNVGDGLMNDAEIVDPIPAGVTYVANSASGTNTDITFSMNQGNTYMSWPPYYTVRNSKGILVKRKATPEMISHIKWNVLKDINPGESTSMEFLVEVSK